MARGSICMLVACLLSALVGAAPSAGLAHISCDDFGFRDDAQAVLDALPTDPFQLDEG